MSKPVTVTIEGHKGYVVLVKEVAEVVAIGLGSDSALFPTLQMIASTTGQSASTVLAAEGVWKREGGKSDLVWRAAVFKGDELPRECRTKRDKDYVVVALSPSTSFCPHGNPIKAYCAKCASLGEAAWWK